MVVKLQSFNYKLLEYYLSKIKKKEGLKGMKVSFLPTSIKKWSVLRSPHVNSKSKEHFEMRVHQRILHFDKFTKRDYFLLENILKVNLLPGISLRVKHKI